MKRWVLVVDDDEFVRVAVGRVLGILGFESVMASDGEQALRLLLSHDTTPVLILTDLMMPNIDGDDFKDVLDSRKDTWGSIPIVLLTSSSWIDSSKKFSGTIRKPIDPQSFLDQVSKFLKIEDRSEA